MLAAEQNDLLHILNILEFIGKIKLYTKNAVSPEIFFELNDQLNLNASLNLLANIGETVSKLSPKLKTEYSEIPWQHIKDFRNIIVHNYLGIDLVVAYKIIKDELEILKINLLKIVNAKTAAKIFDKKELEAAKNSKFYKHVDFIGL